MTSKPHKAKTPQPTLAQLRKRLEQAEDEIEYLKERATRTDWRIRGEIKDICGELLDDDKRLSAVEQDLKKYRDLDQKFKIALLDRMQRDRREIRKGLITLKKWATVIGDEQSSMGLEIGKLTEAYYHVFPERLEPDLKLNKQLRKLFPLPKLNSQKKRP